MDAAMKADAHRSIPTIRLPAAVVIGILASMHPAHAEVYAVTPLGSLGGIFSHAGAVNNVGQIVGNARTSAGLYHAFLYANGTMTDLGTLPGGANSAAEGINLSGQVVGNSEFGPDSTLHATRWFGTTATDIGLQAGRFSTAYAINDAGVIAGAVASGNTYPNAGRWDGDIITDLATVPTDFSSAHGINQSGQIVGQQADPEPFGYVWNGTTATQLPSTGSDGLSDAKGINTSGQIVGWAQVLNIDGGIHAMLWSGNGAPRVATDLGTLGGLHSSASGINAAAQVVGYAETVDQVRHAALWSNGQVVDLNTALSAAEAVYVTLTVATAINDHGWIVADGDDTRTSGMTSTYLLTPVPTSCRWDHGKRGSGHGRNDGGHSHSRQESGRQRLQPDAGMTRDEVQESAWGAPLRINVANNGQQNSELWWYHDNRYLQFTNGCLKSIHD
jgi:probable HAF family extracellular repeat protein